MLAIKRPRCSQAGGIHCREKQAAPESPPRPDLLILQRRAPGDPAFWGNGAPLPDGSGQRHKPALPGVSPASVDTPTPAATQASSLPRRSASAPVQTKRTVTANTWGAGTSPSRCCGFPHPLLRTTAAVSWLNPGESGEDVLPFPRFPSGMAQATSRRPREPLPPLPKRGNPEHLTKRLGGGWG